MFEHRTGDVMSDTRVEFLDANVVPRKGSTIAMYTDGVAKMTRSISGIATCIYKICIPGLIRV